MGVKFNITLIFVMSLVLSSYASAQTAQGHTEYLHEFNEPGESCEVIGAFLYETVGVNFLGQNYPVQRVPVFFQCCIDEETCTSIIFDVYNKDFLADAYTSELINLNYIKSKLLSGELSKNKFVTSGFDVCNFFGEEELNEESVNLAAEAVESTKPLMDKKTAAKVTTNINKAKSLGLIAEVNPYVLVTSIVCVYDNVVLKRAMESLATCNVYLNNIENNYAKSGYTGELKSQFATVKQDLKSYIDSETAQVRGAVNSGAIIVLSTIKSFWNFFVGSIDSGKIEDFKEAQHQKTEYDVANEIYNNIKDYELHLENPNNKEILKKHNDRLKLKIYQYENEYFSLSVKYDSTLDIRPSRLQIFFTNLFFEPNYNISKGLDHFNNATIFKEHGEKLFIEKKFNSATYWIKKSNKDVEISKGIFHREKEIKRDFDKRWLLATLIIIVFLIIKNYITKKRGE